MTIASSDTLFLSILSLDAYDRGTNPGIKDNSLGLSGNIGTASVISYKDNSAGDGFFAVAYNWNGQKVISYRGTDALISSTGAGVSDIFTGWVTGAGILAGQASDASAFYRDVSGQNIYAGLDSNIILTGHSLGGGLAGLVGSLTGDATTIFDNMPYAASAAAAAVAYDIQLGLTDPLAILSGPSGAIFPSASSSAAHYGTDEIRQRHG